MKNSYSYLFSKIIILLVILLFCSCKKNENPVKTETSPNSGVPAQPIVIYSVVPANYSPVGRTIEIHGKNFGQLDSNSFVYIGQKKQSLDFSNYFVFWCDTLINIKPTDTISGNLYIIHGAIKSNEVPYRIGSYVDRKTQVTSVYPVSFCEGSPITIKGTNFVFSGKKTTVNIGGKSASISFLSDTMIVCSAPGVVGDVEFFVIITDIFGSKYYSLPYYYRSSEYQNLLIGYPTIYSISTNYSAVDSTIYISANYLSDGYDIPKVYFGGTEAQVIEFKSRNRYYTWNSNTYTMELHDENGYIKCIVPKTTSPCNVKIVSKCGTATVDQNFYITNIKSCIIDYDRIKIKTVGYLGEYDQIVWCHNLEIQISFYNALTSTYLFYSGGSCNIHNDSVYFNENNKSFINGNYISQTCSMGDRQYKNYQDNYYDFSLQFNNLKLIRETNDYYEYGESGPDLLNHITLNYKDSVRVTQNKVDAFINVIKLEKIYPTTDSSYVRVVLMK